MKLLCFQGHRMGSMKAITSAGWNSGLIRPAAVTDYMESYGPVRFLSNSILESTEDFSTRPEMQ